MALSRGTGSEGEQKASASSEPVGRLDSGVARDAWDAVQDRWTSLERDASGEVKIYDTPLAPAACTRINSSASRASTSSPSTTTPSFAVMTVAFTLYVANIFATTQSRP